MKTYSEKLNVDYDSKRKVVTYKDLIIWQKAMCLVVAIYELTGKFRKTEIYELASQMKRCAISIPSNVAEGRRRSTTEDYHKFLVIAYGAGSELETQIEIVKRLPFGKNLDYIKVDSLLNEVMRMLNKITNRLRS